MLAEPAPGSTIGPKRQFTLTFSSPVSEVLGARRPRVSPALPGSWRLLDAHTLAFRPRGLGFALGTRRAGRAAARRPSRPPSPAATLTTHARVAGAGRARRCACSSCSPSSATCRSTGSRPTRPSGARRGAELVAARSPPPGHFSWRFRTRRSELQQALAPGQANDDHARRGDDVPAHARPRRSTASPGPRVLARADRGRGRRQAPHRRLQLRLRAPQAAAVAQPLAQRPGDPHVARQHRRARRADAARHVPGLRARPGRRRWRGTNPDGSHYDDPGIRYISYFHDGEAIHAFNRAARSARRRASAASSCRSRRPRRSGRTRRSARSSRSRTDGERKRT